MKYDNGDCPETDEQMYKKMLKKSNVPKMTKKLTDEFYNALFHFNVCKADFIRIDGDTTIQEAEEINNDYEKAQEQLFKLFYDFYANGLIVIKGAK